MKERDVWQRSESVLKMPTAVVALLVAGLVGLACSSSGLRSKAGDAGGASGGQADSTSGGITNGSAGGGASNSVDGGSMFDAGAGGGAGQTPTEGAPCDEVDGSYCISDCFAEAHLVDNAICSNGKWTCHKERGSG